eukprot:TRINITY_DN57347_c0_g1_i1.p1 TRINITY_DN57347_c0_g1~~TRINITY_DN57347_c0_g1_i1.p1  ORF type:complete len:201 (+),score=60.82 TRINITY_DN57347_c0_g1_i1:131-733(+)
MVFWEAIVVMQPMAGRALLKSTLSSYLGHVLRSGGVVRKLRNEGVMRLHTGMYAGPQDKRRLYVPFKHRWRIHEPVDEKMWFHGRYVVILFDCNLDTAHSLQSMIYNNETTLVWQMRQKDKHHPVALFRDPHDYEIGHDLDTASDNETVLTPRHSRYRGRQYAQQALAQRWSHYLTSGSNRDEDLGEAEVAPYQQTAGAA